ncbi:acetoacetyl-CoA reductase [Alkalisalibacterium limincola]|uniref:Acetoacetyl-CoA reductase n=1 Tax=Alkalisalibacterium limincola TaxID=2699169 RepID=A0A5C8KX65_9GAMM|nr:acetoacetyl-CoA reductase [Alkalisalibacterium limincola]TXK65830.1 acetoacetyl-CoA reductase [Alkalisalibacterium limincola]
MNPPVALVTGGLGGLGTTICQQLARDHLVVAVDLASDAARVDAWRARDGHEGIEFIACDVTDDAACAALAKDVQARHGGIRTLVNAAGITRDATLRKLEPEHWEDVIRVNLGGAYHMSRHVLEGMLARGEGRIVNIGSINGQTGQFGQTNYAAAKAGLHGFTMSLARETASKGITVNTVSPGYIDTEMTRAIREDIRERIVSSIPVGRIGQPEDIARVVSFLCGPGSDYITGANIPVNGGLFMSF